VYNSDWKANYPKVLRMVQANAEEFYHSPEFLCASR
jgi:hypothetical protein